MKTQISRDAHDSAKRYSGVYQQQGRMLTDADWNTLADIVKERLDKALADVIGSGAPRDRGLRIGASSPPPGFHFEGNRLYAEGVPAQVAPADLGQAFAYTNQADFPAPPDLPDAEGFTLYADVWDRTVDALEDTGSWVTDHLVDPALHGADTTTRTQTMAQIKWAPGFPPIEDLEANPRLGDSRLTVSLRQSQSGGDPCDPCAETVAVSRRIGNYLFRVEVHDVEGIPNNPTEITLKWSSENGAEQHFPGSEPADFKVGDYVYELFDDTTEKHLGVHLAAPFAPARGQLLTSYPAHPPTGFRVRRWDGFVVLRQSGGVWSLAGGPAPRRAERRPFPSSSPPSPGPNGVYAADLPGRDREVGFRISAEGTNPGDLHFTSSAAVLHFRSLTIDLSLRSFVAGDYWLAPVRESIHRLGDRVLDDAPPVGIVHHYLRLAALGSGGVVQPLGTDRGQLLNFSPLTDLKAQDVDYLPACGGANQLFEVKEGIPVDTVQKALDRLCAIGAQHIAFPKPCNTSLYQGVAPRSLKTVADALKLLCDIQARQIRFDPPDGCKILEDAKTVQEAVSRICEIKAENVAYAGCPQLNLPIATVKDALDALCARPIGGGGGCRIVIGPRDQGGQFETLALALASISPRAKVVALCLCLLPGGHTVEEPLLIEGSDSRAINLMICGCGRGSQLTLKGNLVCKGLRSLRIENLLLQIEPQAQLIAQGGFEVTLEGLVVKGTASRPPRTPIPLDLQATLSVRVAECRIEFLSTLGLGPVTNMLTPLHRELGELFVPEVDDPTFEERQSVVARTLVDLPARRRTPLVRSLNLAVEQAAESLPDTLRDTLRRMAATIAPPAPELLTVAASLSDVRTASLRTVPALVLVLEPTAGDTTLVDNEILGIVSVYGEPDKGGLSTDQIKALKTESRWRPTGGETIQFAATPGRLSVDRNEISRLTFGGTPQTQLLEMVNPEAPGRVVTGVYRAAFVAQNRFTFGNNRVLAQDIRLTDNIFEPADPDLGAALAEAAIYHGNGSAEDDRFLFFNLTRRHNSGTVRDLNTMFIV